MLHCEGAMDGGSSFEELPHASDEFASGVARLGCFSRWAGVLVFSTSALISSAAEGKSSETTFAEVIGQHFQAWDLNGDGRLEVQVCLGPGRPGWSPTQVPHRSRRAALNASGSSSHAFATLLRRPWTTRARGRLYRFSRRRNSAHVTSPSRRRRDSLRRQILRASSRNSWRLKKLPMIP